MATQIVVGTASANDLQASIQAELAKRGWSADDDPHMAEYCLVMLGNQKTADQITTELIDLIGDEFDPSFVTWLFDELPHFYPPAEAAPPPPSAPAAARPIQTFEAQERERAEYKRRDGGLYGAAIQGVKRDIDAVDAPAGAPAQRPRLEDRLQGGRAPAPHMEGLPTGPRGGSGPPGLDRALQDDRRQGGRGGAHADRGGRGGPAGMRGGGHQGQFGPGGPQHQQRQGGPGGPGGRPPFPQNGGGMPGFPNQQNQQFMGMLPQQFFQQAAVAMQQAMMQAAQGGGAPGQGGFPGRGGPPGFNPAAQPFQPGGPGGFPQNGGGRPGGPQGPPGGAGGAPGAPGKRPAPSGPPMSQWPKQPTDASLCKHGVECDRGWCPYSHPSPVATKESGLVLDKAPCEKMIGCEDKDCDKSHVSPAQKKAGVPATPISAGGAASTSNGTPTPASSSAIDRALEPESTPGSTTSQFPGAGQKPCKFGPACTRPGCVFVHPWNQRDPSTGVATSTGGPPCRFGVGCMRPDCRFNHPQGRHAFGGVKPVTTYKNKSATFTSSPGAAAAAAVAPATAVAATTLALIAADAADKVVKTEDGQPEEEVVPKQEVEV